MVIADITAVPVSRERKAAYLDFSKRMAGVYRDHGAISVVDYWQSSDSADQGDSRRRGIVRIGRAQEHRRPRGREC